MECVLHVSVVYLNYMSTRQGRLLVQWGLIETYKKIALHFAHTDIPCLGVYVAKCRTVFLYNKHSARSSSILVNGTWRAMVIQMLHTHACTHTHTHTHACTHIYSVHTQTHTHTHAHTYTMYTHTHTNTHNTHTECTCLEMHSSRVMAVLNQISSWTLLLLNQVRAKQMKQVSQYEVTICVWKRRVEAL